MENYKHIVQYYETDKMGVTHHSNYIRWMEEARVDFLKRIGWDYARLESMGVISPVVSVDGKYKKSTTFSDEVFVNVTVTEFTGVKLRLHYDILNDKGEVAFEGNSEHCFMDETGRPIRLHKVYPDFYDRLKKLEEEGKEKIAQV